MARSRATPDSQVVNVRRRRRATTSQGGERIWVDTLWEARTTLHPVPRAARWCWSSVRSGRSAHSWQRAIGLVGPTEHPPSDQARGRSRQPSLHLETTTCLRTRPARVRVSPEGRMTQPALGGVRSSICSISQRKSSIGGWPLASSLQEPYRACRGSSRIWSRTNVSQNSSFVSLLEARRASARTVAGVSSIENSADR